VHYYKRNIGDYSIKAARLSMLQHGAYTLLMDACYDREKFPTLEQAKDWLWASSKEEVEAVEFVLSKFFEHQEDGTYVQKRIQDEIKKYHENSATNKRIAIAREAKRKGKDTKRARTVNEPSTNRHLTKNQELRTKNQEPIGGECQPENTMPALNDFDDDAPKKEHPPTKPHKVSNDRKLAP